MNIVFDRPAWLKVNHGGHLTFDSVGVSPETGGVVIRGTFSGFDMNGWNGIFRTDTGQEYEIRGERIKCLN